MEYPFENFEKLKLFISHPDIKKCKQPLRKCHICNQQLLKAHNVVDKHSKSDVLKHYNECNQVRELFESYKKLNIDVLRNNVRYKEDTGCSFCAKEGLKKEGYVSLHFLFCAEAKTILVAHEKNAQPTESQQSLTLGFSGRIKILRKFLT